MDIIIFDKSFEHEQKCFIDLPPQISPKRVSSEKDLISQLANQNFSLCVVNLTPLHSSAEFIIQKAKEESPHTDIVAITRNKDIEEAIRLVQCGVRDYLDLVEDEEKISSVLKDFSSKNISLQKEIAIPSYQPDQQKEFITGRNREMKKILNTIDRIAPFPSSVLLHGESGTGKELIARMIHNKSKVSKQAFIPVNLPSIPTNLIESVLFGHEKGSFTGAHRRHLGKFEMADGGTIFLDEIGDLPLDVQGKLLRVLQEGEIERVGGSQPIQVNVRVIAATKINLKDAVKANQFRDDLFFRLNVIPINLIPLRMQVESLPEFCNCFLDRYSKKLGRNRVNISSEAILILKRYRWPGNLRELENLIERIVATLPPNQNLIEKRDIPGEFLFPSTLTPTPTGVGLDIAMEQYEKKLIIGAFKKNNWNRRKTAQTLGISYGVLKYKVRKFGIKVPGSTTNSNAAG